MTAKERAIIENLMTETTDRIDKLASRRRTTEEEEEFNSLLARENTFKDILQALKLNVKMDYDLRWKIYHEH